MKKFIREIVLSLTLLATTARAALAAEPIFKWDPDNDIPFSNLGKLLANALILLFVLAAILAFLFTVIGGIQWITAGGDKIAAQSARDRITAAVVGLIIVVAAFGLTLIITTLFGINIFTGKEINFCQFAPSDALFPGCAPK